MWMLIARGVIAGSVVVGVTLLANRSPRLGAFVLTLPIVSILTFISIWQERHDLENISQVSRQTLILVPLGLGFFVPLAFAGRMGLGFWSAFGLGMALASAMIGVWMWVGPKSV